MTLEFARSGATFEFGRLTDPRHRLEAVIFDRDGTLISDVPYNGDPDRIELLPGVADAIGRLRSDGILIALATNQSAVGRGLITWDQATAMHRRLEALVGPFDAIGVCPHTPLDGCTCRKPRPGLLRSVASALGVPANRCAMVGDRGSDALAATRAGMAAALVRSPATSPSEVARARRDGAVVAPSMFDAVTALRGARVLAEPRDTA